MTLRAAVLIATVVAVVPRVSPLLSPQAAKAPDPKAGSQTV